MLDCVIYRPPKIVKFSKRNKAEQIIAIGTTRRVSYLFGVFLLFFFQNSQMKVVWELFEQHDHLEAYLGACQTSMMELLSENRLAAFNY